MSGIHEHFRERFNQADSEYRLNDIIGAGGQAWVFGGYDTVQERDVAVKVFPDIQAVAGIDDSHITAFSGELTRLQALNGNRNIVTIFHHGVFLQGDRRNPFIVMERADDSLDSVVKKGAVGAPRAMSYLSDAMNGMASAHNRGILHCDLKPANLLVKDQVVLVSDFGVSIDRSGETHTLTHDVRGTYHYMPKEHFEGKPRKASDVYAMGVIAYQLLTGELPRRPAADAHQNEALRWYYAHQVPEVASFEAVAGSQRMNMILETVEPVVRNALSVDYRDRPSDMGEFSQAFREAARHGAAAWHKHKKVIASQPASPVKKEPSKPPTKLQLTFDTPAAPELPAQQPKPEGVVSGEKPRPEPRKAAYKKPLVKKHEPAQKQSPDLPSRRKMLRLGATALGVGALMATGIINQEEIRNFFDRVTGPSHEDRKATRSGIWREIFKTIPDQDYRFEMLYNVVRADPELAKELSTTVSPLSTRGTLQGSLAAYYPEEAVGWMRTYSEQGQYDAASNVAMGLASYINLISRENWEGGVSELSRLQARLRDPSVGRELQASLIDMCMDQGGELAPGAKYTSKDLGRRLVEYASDPAQGYQYAYWTLVRNMGRQADALRYAATTLLERSVAANDKKLLNHAFNAANKMAQMLPEEAVELAERFYKEARPLSEGSGHELAVAAAPLAPDAVRSLIGRAGNNAFDMTGVALAEYNAAYVEDLAEKYEDGDAVKAWLMAAANPGHEEYKKNALKTLSSKIEIPDGTDPYEWLNVWQSCFMGRALMANTIYADLNA